MKLIYILSLSILFALACGQVSANDKDRLEIRKLIEQTYASNAKSGDGERYASIFPMMQYG